MYFAFFVWLVTAVIRVANEAKGGHDTGEVFGQIFIEFLVMIMIVNAFR
jgi:hypothetical protein